MTGYHLDGTPQPNSTDTPGMAEADSPTQTPVLDWIGQLMCGLQGHDEIVHFAGGRMFLRCVNCGHETPGWDTQATPRPPARTPFGAKADDIRRAA